MIKQIIEKVKALPPGRLVLHLDADGWSLPPFCNTDDLHSLVEQIEKLEAMLAEADTIIFNSEQEIEWLPNRLWRATNGKVLSIHNSALEAYDALKESQP